MKPSSTQLKLYVEWRPCPGFEGYYSISEAGQVRRDAPWLNRKAGHCLKSRLTRDGYHRVTLYAKPLRADKLVHCLVAEAFLGTNAGGLEVNHIDGDKSNNSVGNLEYVTKRENTEHKMRNRLHAYGHRNGMAKLSEKQVRRILALLESSPRPSFAEIGRKFGVNGAHVARIARGQSWRHLSTDQMPF